MDISKELELLTSSNHTVAYKTFKSLLLICEKSKALYPYFDTFIDMMEHDHNSYIRTRGLSLIAYQSKWDDENKINAIIDQWLKHIEDEKPITARQCIKDSVIIAKYKPELADTIYVALEKYEKIYDESMQSLIYKDRKKAIRQIRQYICID